MNATRVRLLAWKEVRQLRRDPLLLRILVLMPVLQLVLLGYVVAADVTRMPTAVVDLDRTPLSRQLGDAFEASDYFDVRRHPGGESELRGLMDSGEIRVAVVVPAGTQARLDRGETAPLGIVVDGSDSQSASLGAGYASRIVARFEARRVAAPAGAGHPGRPPAGEGMPHTPGVPGLDASVRVLYDPTLSSVNTMIPGLVAFILMLSLMVVMSQAVVKERESGTLEQMFVTPIRPGEYLVGKVAPYAVIASVQASLVLAVGILWFRVPFRGEALVVVAGLALFMLTSIGMGLIVSLLSRTRQQAQQSVMFLALPMMLLSGFIFPIDSMPAPIVPLTRLIPLRYALEVLRGAMVKGAGFEALATPLAALTVFGVLLFGTAVLVTRRRLTE
ncbi:ABC transporter permease [Mobilicoccus sp.]|uniref:ABC transporter permease n=1 Tax=Mobilicoccus sp. TaxID=2034349 RepID=UPI00289CA75D|nr:ABC transporter permease [Mobilicoccus sp.]